jgi:hypothetical protein
MDSNFLDVLEDMAFNASDNSSERAIQKWTALGYTHAEAEPLSPTSTSRRKLVRDSPHPNSGRHLHTL